MCCHICFWADRVLANIKCPKYFSRNHNELMAKYIKQHLSSGVYQSVCFSAHISINPKHQDQWIQLPWWTVGHTQGHFSELYNVRVTVFTCFAVGSNRDQWKQSADRLTHTKALCHYRDQTVQGHRLSLLLLPLKKCRACLFTYTRTVT